MVASGDIDVVYATYHVDIGETPFFVVIDYTKQKIVICIRGTWSMKVSFLVQRSVFPREEQIKKLLLQNFWQSKKSGMSGNAQKMLRNFASCMEAPQP